MATLARIPMRISLVGRCDGVVQSASPGIILQASNAGTVGWQSNSRRLWMARSVADDRFTSRGYIESSARARMAARNARSVQLESLKAADRCWKSRA
jgi:hypothetical protein